MGTQLEPPDLQTLLRISMAIHSLQALYAARGSGVKELLEKQLLELIFESVPAERGFIVLLNDVTELPAELAGYCRITGPSPVPVDRAIVERVIASGEALQINNSPQSPICCLMAIPLTMRNRIQGIIYLDSSEPGSFFTEEQMELMSAIASIAVMALEHARYVEWLEGENQRLRSEIEVELEHNLVGESPAIQQVFHFISRVAPTESTVLITGESGTGKELVARALHQNSKRAAKPFVAINCAALTDTLLESEFFGHEKGSFTGAISQKKGKLEVADGGTIFLDEIGELAPALQAKLLRVLQERCFERVGGTRSIQVNLRVIAATNRNLAAAIKEGAFRLDLFYRLNVVSVAMPPLRERRKDIPLLAKYFAVRVGKHLNRPVTGISPQARVALQNYDWPGNIRELENAIERAVVLGSTDLIRLEDLPDTVAEAALEGGGSSGSAGGKYHVAIHETRKQTILTAMEQAQGSVTEAARLLGVHPNYLHRLIHNLNLRPGLKRFASGST